MYDCCFSKRAHLCLFCGIIYLAGGGQKIFQLATIGMPG
jgi:hypothetical protein